MVIIFFAEPAFSPRQMFWKLLPYISVQLLWFYISSVLLRKNIRIFSIIKGSFALILHKPPVYNNFSVDEPFRLHIYKYSVLRFLSNFEKKRTTKNSITVSSHICPFGCYPLYILKIQDVQNGNKFPIFQPQNAEALAARKSLTGQGRMDLRSEANRLHGYIVYTCKRVSVASQFSLLSCPCGELL